MTLISKSTYRGVTEYRLKLGKRYYTICRQEPVVDKPLKDITNAIFAPKAKGY